MNFTLREPTADDFFPMLSLLSKLGIEELKEAGNAGDAETAGLKVFQLLMVRLGENKTELYAFLGSLAGMSVDAVKALSLPNFTRLLITLLKLEGFRDFFTEVSALLN